MDYTLPDSLASLRENARRFVEEVLRPRERELPPAEGALPAGLREQSRERRQAFGLWGLSVPAAAGGRGLGWLERAVVEEEMHRSTLGVRSYGLLAAGEPPAPLHRLTGAARDRYLAPCLDGRRQAHQVLVPPGGNLQVSEVPGGVVLHGELTAVPAFMAADLVLLVVGWAGYLLSPGTPGYSVTRRRPTMGAAELVDLVWEDCRLGSEQVLPDAAPDAAKWQAGVRVAVLGAGAVGAAEWCLEQAIHYANVRKTFGKPLADRQAIQWMIADSARELHASRLLVYRACDALDRGEEAQGDASAAKIYATEAACHIVDRVLQIHGGSGYSRDLPFERYWRELRLYRLLEGGNDRLLVEGAEQRVAGLQR